MSKLSKEAVAFITEIEDVCRKHGLSLSTELYDGLEVWPLLPGEEPLKSNGIFDWTNPENRITGKS